MRSFSVLSVALAVLVGRCIAGDLPEASNVDFELSDGRAFVRLSELPPKPTLINFWRADCPPCLKELPELARLARQAQVRVVLVAVHKPAEIEMLPLSLREHLASPALLLYAPSQPRGLLSRFGNSVGALPHSIWVDKQRNICAKRTGMVDAAWLKESRKACND